MVSIHPMFRFKNPVLRDYVIGKITFQYILCFGSSIDNNKDELTEGKFQYILCFGSSSLKVTILLASSTVSIHPMFRFK